MAKIIGSNSRALFFPAFIATVVALGLVWVWLSRAPKSKVWEYIPNTALAVLSLNHDRWLNDEEELITGSLALFSQYKEVELLLSALTADSTKVTNLLRKDAVFYSFHPVGNRSLGLISYIPVENVDEVAWMLASQDPAIRYLNHAYQGTKITDIRSLDSQPLFSFFLLDNHLIISSRSELLEDVVRRTKQRGQDLVGYYQSASSIEGQWTLWMQKEAIPFFYTYLSDALVPQWEFVKSVLPPRFDFTLRTTNEASPLVLSTQKTSGTEVTHPFMADGSSGSPFGAQAYISQSTALLYRLSYASAATLNDILADNRKKNRPESWKTIQYHLGDKADELIENVANELLLAQWEEGGYSNQGKVALIKVGSAGPYLEQMEKLSRLSMPQDTPFGTDHFSGYTLYTLHIPELPATLYGPLMEGFGPTTYATFVAPYWVLASSSGLLKSYLSDYENQLTWANNPKQAQLLADSRGTLQLAINVEKTGSYFSIISFDLPAKRKAEHLTIDYGITPRTANATIHLYPSTGATPSALLDRFFEVASLDNWSAHDFVLPFLSELMGRKPALLQTDSTGALFAYDVFDSKKWNPIYKLDGPLVVPPFVTDFMDVGRGQYILATPNTLYNLDKADDGTITTFSSPMPSGSLVMDWFRLNGNKDGSSRFLVLDQKENLLVWEQFDKAPKMLTRQSSFRDIRRPVTSFTLQGVDYFVVTEQQGKLSLLKTNGSVVKGFPVDLGWRLEGGFFPAIDPSSGQTVLSGVTALGELIRISTGGEIIERKQLYRPESTTSFRTLFDINGLDWLVMRYTDSKVAIFTQKGDELFEIKGLRPGSDVQYHFFGSENRFISIRSGGNVLLFDLKGKMIGDKPLPTEMPIRVVFQPEYAKLLLATRVSNQVKIWSIKIQ